MSRETGPGTREPGRSTPATLSPATYAGLGLQFAASIVLFLYLGLWLDTRLHTSPVFVLLGVFVGAGGAFYGVYRRLMAAQRAAGERRAPGKR